MEKLIQKNPKYTIIIPVYHVEEYICQCIDSVLSQSFTDFELIIVDDGSSDTCGKICEEYERIDKRVTVIHKVNGGLSDARNVGLLFAKGEYIYFLDSDDWIESSLLKCVSGYLDKGYDMVVFNYFTAYPDCISSEISHLLGEFNTVSDEERTEFYFSILLKAHIGWSAWDRVFKKSLIDEYNLSFADNKKIFMEDLYFSCCYCAFTKRILSVDDRLLFYRQRDDSIMHTDGAGLNFNRINEFGKALYQFYSTCLCQPLIAVFPQIYYCLIRNNIWKLEEQKKTDLSEIRRLIIEDIDDISFFKSQMRRLQSQRYISAKAYSKREFMNMKAVAKYLLNGRSNSFRIRSWLINAIYKKT